MDRNTGLNARATKPLSLPGVSPGVMIVETTLENVPKTISPPAMPATIRSAMFSSSSLPA
jgi:hypothetical protein